MVLSFIKSIIKDKLDDSIGCGGLILVTLAVLAFITVFSLIGWWIEWLLWGAIMVKIFSLPALTFGRWQDLTFFSVCSFLILQFLLIVKTEVN